MTWLMSFLTAISMIGLWKIWQKPRAEGDDDVGAVAAVRTFIGLGIGIYLIVRYPWKVETPGGFLSVLSNKFVSGAAWAAGGMLAIGLVLVFIGPRDRRGYGLRLWFSGGRGLGPVTTVLLAAGCMYVLHHVIYLFVDLGLNIFTVLMVIVVLTILTLTAAIALWRGFHAGTGHPLLPALAAPWFAVGVIINSQLVSDKLSVIPQPVDDFLQWGGLVVTIVLSTWEYRRLRKHLGVGLRTGAPEYRLENGVMTWLPLGQAKPAEVAQRVDSTDEPGFWRWQW